MKIQYASDIHLELSDNLRFIKSEPFEVTGDVLVFAGDTGYLRDRTLPNLRFWKWASANYREVLLVPGNHEFYGNGDVLAYGDSWSREILHNVHYYQNKVVRIDNVGVIKVSIRCKKHLISVKFVIHSFFILPHPCVVNTKSY